MFPLQSISHLVFLSWPRGPQPLRLAPLSLPIVVCSEPRFLEPMCPGRLAYRFGSSVGRQPLRPGRGRRSLRRQKNRTIANGLFANLKLSEDVQIALRSNSLEIVQQASSTTHLRQKTTPGGIVFLVTPHVIRQRVDAGGQNCDCRNSSINSVFFSFVIDIECAFFPAGRLSPRGATSMPSVSVRRTTPKF